MSLQIGDALSRGFEKLTTGAGLQLAAVYTLLTLLSTVGINSVTVAMAGLQNTPALALPLGVVGGGALFVVAVLANLVVSLVLFRTMAHERTELGSIPSDATRSLVRGSVFLLVANLLVGVAVGVGFVFLAVLLVANLPVSLTVLVGFFVVVLSVFLFVSLIFTQVYVAVEDMGPVESMGASWRLSKGNRLSIFLLFLVLLALAVGVGFVGIVPSLVSPLLGSVATTLLSSVVNVFLVAVIVDAYLQLSRNAPAEGPDSATMPPA